jgi:hypothetical protein
LQAPPFRPPESTKLKGFAVAAEPGVGAPSAEKIAAAALDITPWTVQRGIAAIKSASFIRREERRIPGKGSNTNRYHLDGLIKAAQSYAEEKLQQEAERDQKRAKAAIRLVTQASMARRCGSPGRPLRTPCDG